MSKHTPGPWAVGRRRGQEVWVDAPGGEPTLGFKAWDGLLSAWGSDDDPERGLEVARANARLAAAAPELLAALERVMPAAETWVNDALMGGEDSNTFEAELDALEKARAAIRKAKGEA